DGFPLYAEDPLASAHRKINHFLVQASERLTFWLLESNSLPAGKQLLAAAPDEKVQLFRAVLIRILFWTRFDQVLNSALEGEPADAEQANKVKSHIALRKLLGDLLVSKISLPADDLAIVVSLAWREQEQLQGLWCSLPYAAILNLVEKECIGSEPQ